MSPGTIQTLHKTHPHIHTHSHQSCTTAYLHFSTCSTIWKRKNWPREICDLWQQHTKTPWADFLGGGAEPACAPLKSGKHE